MNKRIRVLTLYSESDAPSVGSGSLVTPNGMVEPQNSGRTQVDVKTQYVDTSNEGLAGEVEAICEALSDIGFEAAQINLNNNLSLLIDTLERKEMDVIFNLVESFHNESEPEMYVAALYELYKIPYTGAGPRALGNCLDKITAKRILKSCGVKVPRYKLVRSLPLNEPIGLPYPLIVKPVHEDASAGIENESVVENRRGLLERINYIHRYFNQPALVEEFINGREFNVSIVGNKPPIPLPVSEIDFSTMPHNFRRIVSYQAKWMPEHITYQRTIPVCPAQIPDLLADNLSSVALRAHKAMGTRDYSRVDMRINEDGDIYLLEVNPNPDLSRDAGFMRAAGAHGWSYEETLKNLVEYALDR